MGTDVSKLTVLFEDPFWIGLFERVDGGRYTVCKITFGAEPRDYEVFDFLLRHWNQLRFSPSIPAAAAAERHVNPKRMSRLIRREMTSPGPGTKAQQALAAQREAMKQESAHVRSQHRADEAEARFEQRKQKRKQKHRGH